MTGTTMVTVAIAASLGRPQWSPVLMTGTTGVTTLYVATAAEPQWSPVLMTGTTRHSRPLSTHHPQAAMEPRADDGDDVEDAEGASLEQHAAMEPRADDGDDGSPEGCRLTCNDTGHRESCSRRGRQRFSVHLSRSLSAQIRPGARSPTAPLAEPSAR